MVSVLADGMIFRCDQDGSNLRTEYLEDVPVEYFNSRFDALPRILWNFGYSEQRTCVWLCARQCDRLCCICDNCVCVKSRKERGNGKIAHCLI